MEFCRVSADPWRSWVRGILESNRFDTIMGFVILGNVCMMVVQTNYTAWQLDGKVECSDFEDSMACNWQSRCRWAKGTCVDRDKPADPHVLFIFDTIFLVIYFTELAARLYVWRLPFFKGPWRQVAWNWLDLTVVGLGTMDYIINLSVEPDVNGDQEGGSAPIELLRIFRIFRLLRVMRVLSFFGELRLMVQGFVFAMMAMVWGGVMICILILLWSILAVELVSSNVAPPGVKNTAALERKLGANYIDFGDNEEWCREAFSTVQVCMLMLFQTLCAGDSWGACAVPVIKAKWWTVFIFAGSLISITLGFTNLILAVIVERSKVASSADKAKKVDQVRLKRQEAASQIYRILKECDTDGSGLISWEELIEGYEEQALLRERLTELFMQKEDLQVMYSLMVDENEEVRIKDLVDNLQRCESQSLNTQMMMVSLAINSIGKQVEALLPENDDGCDFVRHLTDHDQPPSFQAQPLPIDSPHRESLSSSSLPSPIVANIETTAKEQKARFAKSKTTDMSNDSKASTPMVESKTTTSKPVKDGQKFEKQKAKAKSAPHWQVEKKKMASGVPSTVTRLTTVCDYKEDGMGADDSPISRNTQKRLRPSKKKGGGGGGSSKTPDPSAC